MALKYSSKRPHLLARWSSQSMRSHDFLPRSRGNRAAISVPSQRHNGQLIRRACIGVYRPIATASCCRSWFMPHCLLAVGPKTVRIYLSFIYPFFFLAASLRATSRPHFHLCEIRYRKARKKSWKSLSFHAWSGSSFSPRPPPQHHRYREVRSSAIASLAV